MTMMMFILKSDPILFATVGVFSCLLFAGLFFISLKKILSSDPVTENNSVMSLENMHAIAGEDVYATQLDLARAYIEIQQLTSAKNILHIVIKQGNTTQQAQARALLAHMSSM